MKQPIRSHELIMVMGVQRSGTNALFDSLATDKTLSAFPEDIDSAFYINFRLRPVAELAPLIQPIHGRILLKPISETAVRSLEELAEEFLAYALRFVWIYRDPVNVLHSMHREKWIAAEDIDRPGHLLDWRKRNEYALQFRQQCPEQIAIVRYEDLCLDPAVFRRLTHWLHLNCESYFRRDSVKGRRHVPGAAQKSIDDSTADTLRALDAARTFKARQIYQLKERIVSRLREGFMARGARSRDPESDHAGDVLSPSEPGRLPSTVEGLHFWFNAAAICQSNALITAHVREGGPHHMVAAKVENGPYGLLSLNHRGTLYYPHTKVEERRCGASGTLIFGREDWNFLFDARGFTVFALFRPNVPCYPPYNQEASSLFRVGSWSEAAPAFLLKWDGCSNSSSAVMFSSRRAGELEKSVISTPAQSHRRQQWRLIIVQDTGGPAGEFSISANGVHGESIHLAGNFPPEPSGDWILELGGFTAERESLFYGEIAEIIIFKRALANDERSALTRYLIETHLL